MLQNTTAASLQAVKDCWKTPIDDVLAKSFTTGTGLVAYDLQPKALTLYPVITPIRNRIPRIGPHGGTATNWKAITGINTAHMALGISEGNRGGIPATSTRNYMATYKSFGMEDNVTFEADYAAQGFDDVKALAIEGLLRAVMIGEEELIIGGNTSLQLGVTPTPTLIASGSGSSLAAAALTVQVAALSPRGYATASVAGGVPSTVTRTNADGSSDTFGGGSAQISASAVVTPASREQCHRQCGAGAGGGRLCLVLGHRRQRRAGRGHHQQPGGDRGRRDRNAGGIDPGRR